MLKKMTLLAIALLLTVPSAFAASYQIDPVHTQIHFTVPHLVVFKVRGNFNDVVGSVEADAANNSLTGAKATIQVASISTRNQKRDDHLRSADFFDAGKYPEMAFVSKKVEGSGSSITVTGDLTIKGTTKEVVLKGGFLGATTDPWGNQRAGFEATGMINRKEFGLMWNKALETGGMVVGDKIEIGLEIEAVMK